MIDNLFFIILLIFSGYISKRLQLLPVYTASALNLFVINIGLPALILLNLPNMPSLKSILAPVTIHWIALLLHLILLWIVVKCFKISKNIWSVLLVVSTVGNTAFLGIPVIESYFGREKLVTALLYDELGSGVLFTIYGAFLIPFLKGEKFQSIKDVATKFITFPPFVAMILGLGLKGVEYSPIIYKFLNTLSLSVIPCAMFSVGLDFKIKLPREVLSSLFLGLGLKLLVIPFILFLTFKNVFNLDELAPSIIQAGMPPMISAGALAITSGLNSSLSNALVAYGLLFSFLTTALLYHYIY